MSDEIKPPGRAVRLHEDGPWYNVDTGMLMVRDSATGEWTDFKPPLPDLLDVVAPDIRLTKLEAELALVRSSLVTALIRLERLEAAEAERERQLEQARWRRGYPPTVIDVESTVIPNPQ